MAAERALVDAETPIERAAAENPLFRGVWFVDFVDVDRGVDMLDFGRRFEARFGRRASSTDALTYDATHLLLDAVRQGATTGPAIRDHLDALGRSRPPYVGITGPIRFDEHGDVDRSYVLRRVPPVADAAVRADAVGGREFEILVEEVLTPVSGRGAGDDHAQGIEVVGMRLPRVAREKGVRREEDGRPVVDPEIRDGGHARQEERERADLAQPLLGFFAHVVGDCARAMTHGCLLFQADFAERAAEYPPTRA